jgi:hypothetical protein
VFKPSSIFRSLQSHTSLMANRLRFCCAVRTVDMELEKLLHTAALAATDGLTQEHLQQVVLQADQVCARTAARFSISVETLRSESRQLLLLSALAAVKPKPAGFVVPFVILMGNR